MGEFDSEESARQLYQGCRIDRVSLGMSLSPSLSNCEEATLVRVERFVRTSPALTHFVGFIAKRKILQRALLVATEALGPPSELAPAQQNFYEEVHHAFVLEMLWMWILDDCVDRRRDASGIQRGFLLQLDGRLGSGPFARDSRTALAPTYSVQEALFAVAAEYNLTPARSRPRGALIRYAMRRFLLSYLSVHGRAQSWQTYTVHRSYNSGLWSTIAHSANYHLQFLGHAAAPSFAMGYSSLIEKHALIGAIANDLFGLSKDLEEGVETSFTILRRIRSPQATDQEIVTELVEEHNARLDALFRDYKAAKGSSKRKVILHSALRTCWAVRVLHHQFADIYASSLLATVVDDAPG